MTYKKSTKVAALALAAVLTAGTFTGCGVDREAQIKYEKSGITSLSEGDYDKAIDYFNKALDEAGISVGAQEFDISYYLAAAQYVKGDYEGAIKTYTALAEYDKNDAQPLILRGSLYASEKEMEHAQADYKEAIKRQPNDYENYILIYQNLAALGYTDQALTYLNLGLEVEGSKAENYLNRGRIYLLLEQYDAAEVALNKALDAGDKTAYVYLAKLYAAQGNDEHLTVILNKYKSAEKLTTKDHSNIAQMEIDQGNYEEAIEEIESALKDAKDKKLIQTLMKNHVACLEHMGDYAGALEQTNVYIEKYPSDQEMLREQAFLNELNRTSDEQ